MQRLGFRKSDGPLKELCGWSEEDSWECKERNCVVEGQSNQDEDCVGGRPKKKDKKKKVKTKENKKK